MSIFSSIMNKIFSRAEAAPASTAGAAPGAAQGTGNAQASSGGVAWQEPSGGSASGSAGPGGSASSGSSASGGQASAGGAQSVDVEAVLSGMAAKNGQKLDWKRSIVDLMKLLDLDSSLSARKELAQELHYTGDPNDSAKMNMWLHKQVMQKLAENGGKVPESLRS